MNAYKKALITLVIVVPAVWLLRFCWQQRPILYENYTFNVNEAKRLKIFPEAQYAYGLHAWFRNDTTSAISFFRQTVSHDVLFIDSWLKLAEAEALMGRFEKAKKILTLTESLTAPIIRWKWPQALLAHELGMEEIFIRNINDLLAHQKKTQDAFQLLDIHYRGDTAATLQVLRHENIVSFLKWLMRWDRTGDTYIVWQKITEIGKSDQKITLQYVHFLVNKKYINRAKSIWKHHNNNSALTNAGFEKEITKRAFDWRYSSNKNGQWEIKRVGSPVYEGSYSLRVFFAGYKNISFGNLYQIVPVEPLKSYRLTYRWRSEKITTDQGPFVEIYGYDQKGLYRKGPMIRGTNDWLAEAIEFIPPEGCQAIIVRLRRHPSHRFDCNIAGTLWLDDFRLEKVN